jgi:hypothetical protein
MEKHASRKGKCPKCGASDAYDFGETVRAQVQRPGDFKEHWHSWTKDEHEYITSWKQLERGADKRGLNVVDGVRNPHVGLTSPSKPPANGYLQHLPREGSKKIVARVDGLRR